MRETGFLIIDIGSKIVPRRHRGPGFSKHIEIFGCGRFLEVSARETLRLKSRAVFSGNETRGGT